MQTPQGGTPITVDDVEAAAERIRGYVHRTPVLRYASLDALVGAEVHLKAESLQRTGAFKVRGAFNALLSMPVAERAGGVLAVSSGNHAQAVALAARSVGVPATIVIPEGANPVKVAATATYGAQIVSEGVSSELREGVVQRLARERGVPVVHPFDDVRVMAGQGTVGLELTDQVEPPDAVVVPVGGGGLISGVSTAVKARWPDVAVVGVEPEAGDDAARSLRSGTRVLLDAAPDTVCDGVRSMGLGENTWAVIRERVDDIVTVPDATVLEAVRELRHRTGLIVEPSGALPLAAMLSGALGVRRVALVVSGGNIDPALLA